MQVPKYLDRIGKKVYRRLHHHLSLNGLLQDIDELLIEQFAEAYSSYRKNIEIVKKEGDVLISDKGNRYIHPAKSAMSSDFKQMQQLAKVMGIGVANREKLKIIIENDDEFIKFLKNNQ